MLFQFNKGEIMKGSKGKEPNYVVEILWFVLILLIVFGKFGDLWGSLAELFRGLKDMISIW